MKASTVKALGIATAVVAVGAIAASKFRSSGTRASSLDAPVLPVLEKRVNDVASVVVESGEGTLTLARSGSDWTLSEKSGYRAKPEKVRELILALREARVVEEKTSDASRFDKLGLDAPDAEGSTSKRVTLKDDKGETIVSTLIGKRRLGMGAPNQRPGAARPDDQYYVLPSADGPAVLATGKLMVDARAVGWLEQQFLDVSRDRIRAARVTQPDGANLEVVRAEMDADELQLVSVPEGKEPKEPNGTRPFLDALARLRFDDVRSTADAGWEGAEVTKAEFFTEHGLRVTVETMQAPKPDAPVVDGAEPQMTTWARFAIDVAPDDAPTLAMAEDEAPAAGEDVPEEGEAEESGPAPPTEDELRREAQELGGPLEGWTFAIPTWKTTALRMQVDALVQDVPPPPPPQEPDVEPGVEPDAPPIPGSDPGEAAGDPAGGAAVETGTSGSGNGGGN